MLEKTAAEDESIRAQGWVGFLLPLAVSQTLSREDRALDARAAKQAGIEGSGCKRATYVSPIKSQAADLSKMSE